MRFAQKETSTTGSRWGHEFGFRYQTAVAHLVSAIAADFRRRRRVAAVSVFNPTTSGFNFQPGVPATTLLSRRTTILSHHIKTSALLRHAAVAVKLAPPRFYNPLQ